MARAKGDACAKKQPASDGSKAGINIYRSESSIEFPNEGWLQRLPAGNRLGAATSSASTEINHKNTSFLSNTLEQSQSRKERPQSSLLPIALRNAIQ